MKGTQSRPACDIIIGNFVYRNSGTFSTYMVSWYMCTCFYDMHACFLLMETEHKFVTLPFCFIQKSCGFQQLHDDDTPKQAGGEGLNQITYTTLSHPCSVAFKRIVRIMLCW